jgi:predicted nuclease with TOPRIM domain
VVEEMKVLINRQREEINRLLVCQSKPTAYAEQTTLQQTSIQLQQQQQSTISALLKEKEEWQQQTATLQRRVKVLEESNSNLAEELKLAIEKRKNASRVTERQKDAEGQEKQIKQAR